MKIKITKVPRQPDIKAYGGYLDSVGKLNDTLFALGGDLQSHGSDWSNGASYIGAGLSHEMNPNGGVQVGVDSQGTPNLVEQDEVIYDDYVYSNRIPIDAATKEKFHIGKKKDMTYADLARKLGKEIEERPNDPISKAGYRSQMLALQEEQERQKQKMEAERAREAFEAMSPEEQTALMQQVAQAQQQEAVVQEQAMAEQGMVPEETVAPEEAAMVSQEEMPVDGEEGVLVEGEEMAEGGNLFADGGALEWLKKNHPEMGNKEEIAAAMERRKSLYSNQPLNNTAAFEFITKGEGNFLSPYVGQSADKANKHYRELLSYGMNPKVAFGLSYPIPEEPKYPEQRANYQKLVSERNKLWKSMMDNDYREWSKQHASTSSKEKELKGTTTDTSKQVKTVPSNSYSTPYQEKLARQRAVAAAKTQRGVGNSTSTDLPIKEQQAQAANIEQASEPLSNRAVTPSYGGSNYRVPRRGNNVVSRGNRGLNPYSYYTNGTDGIGEPTGFKVGNNGLIRQEDYTQEYRDLVNTLTANDIRQWAAEHPNDPSLLSFLAKGNKLENLTDEQWRKGATDGKYGFMHHVSDQILQDNLAPNYYLGELPEATVTPNGNVVASSEVGDFAADKASGYPTADPSTYTASATAGNAAGTTEEDKDIIMNHRSTWPRYAGLFGPVVGLGMMAAGVGRPDYSALDAAVRMGTGDIRLADYKPLGDYLTYRPMDIWAEQNRLDANARATDRAIRNSGLPTATKNASLLANAYNNQIASSELYKKALEYNDAKEAQVKGFNRGTNQFNAEAYNKNSQFNANAMNRAKQYQANLALNAAAQKMNADAAWYNGIYGNLSGLFEGLGDLGRENYEYNQFVDYLGSGAVPGVTKKKLVDAGYAKWAKDGGKVQKKKNKKGLTF